MSEKRKGKSLSPSHLMCTYDLTSLECTYWGGGFTTTDGALNGVAMETYEHTHLTETIKSIVSPAKQLHITPFFFCCFSASQSLESI